ncbi:MAG: methyltransferase domain-containing protein [Kofleriaceae bacterium]|nr:methyltransferase domain-containing protein [Kofleriaceae bacterium]
MTVNKRSLKVEKLARIYDDEIAPVWGTRFGKMLLRNLAVPERGQVLDISCGTGSPTIEILRRMNDGSRIIAIDASSAMLDVARRKVADLGPLGKKGVFFRTESPVPKLSFADDVYDLVVCNLGLNEMPSLEHALRDFARVAKKGGEVRCTLPLAGTFQEFHDLYREVLIKHDKHEALERLERYIARYPTMEHVERCMTSASLDGGLETEEFTLLFKSSREFFFAPVIEFGPLSEWKEIAGGGQEMQDVFWYIKEAIDAYFDGRPFQVTVKASCLIGRKTDVPLPLPAAVVVPEVVADVENDTSDGEEELDADLMPPHRMAAGSVQMADPEDLQVEELDPDMDTVSSGEQELEAFIEGAKRPPHLDDLDD